jgi:hypothetical protein
MKRSAVAALGAALIVTAGASSAAQAALIDFGVSVLGGAPTYMGTSLDELMSFDLDQAALLVESVGSGDASGLVPVGSGPADEVTVSPDTTNIIYGFGTGPAPLGADVILSWTGSTGDTFTETLTTADSINRGTLNAITLLLSGTLSDTSGVFTNSPVSLMLTASQAGGPGLSISASFTNTTTAGAIPETSTWAMMALGFGALGYAASRRRKANIAMLSP